MGTEIIVLAVLGLHLIVPVAGLILLGLYRERQTRVYARVATRQGMLRIARGGGRDR